jgi:hypothetical protein
MGTMITVRKLGVTAMVVVALMLAGACGRSGVNAGIHSVFYAGRVSNAAGTCVLTEPLLPYVRHGLLCAGERLGEKGNCIEFTGSNINAATSDLPTVSGVHQIAAMYCRGPKAYTVIPLK